MGAFGDPRREHAQAVFDGPIDWPLRRHAAHLGSQAASSSVKAAEAGAAFGTPVYVTCNRWWRRLQPPAAAAAASARRAVAPEGKIHRVDPKFAS